MTDGLSMIEHIFKADFHNSIHRGVRNGTEDFLGFNGPRVVGNTKVNVSITVP